MFACVICVGAAAAFAQSVRTAVPTITYEAGPDGWVDGASPQSSSTGFSAVTAIADAGYHFVNWSDGVTANPRTDSAPSTNKVVTANFIEDGSQIDPGPYTLTFTATGGGTIQGTTPQTVSRGANSRAVTAVPAAGHHFVRWTGTGGFHTTSSNPLTVIGVTADSAITAAFAIDTHTLKYAAGTGGSLSGSVSQTVDYGAKGTAVTAVPSIGRHFVRWSDGALSATRTDVDVDADIDVTASFAIDTYALRYAATAGGSISGVASQSVDYGGSGTQVMAVPALGQHFVSWSDGVPIASRTDANVTGDVNVTAAFAAGADARDDGATAYGRPVSVSALSNDDPGVGALASFTQPSDGSVVLGADPGFLLYAPDQGFLGTDSFAYTTESGATATVTVTVLPNVSAPKNVAVAQVTTHSVNVTWSAPDSFGSGFASYVVAWRESGAGTWNVSAPIVSSGILHAIVNDPAPTPGATFEFRVAVTDSGAVSATSSSVPFSFDDTPVAGAIAPVTMLSGSSATLTVDGVGPDASVTIGADAGDTPGVGSVVVGGLAITVVSDSTFSGEIVLPVTVTDGGSSRVIEALLTVVPTDPTSVGFGITSKTATGVRWTASAGATGYRVYVGASLAATASGAATSCTVAGFFGPKGSLTVQAIGADGTTSNPVRAAYQPIVKVTAALVSFSGTSSKLSGSGKNALKAVAKLMKSQGFTTAWLDAYPGTGAKTTSAKKKLAAARVKSVKTYLTAQFKSLHVKVSLKTVAWSSKHSASMSTKYRRAEVALH
jgi:hypothetical protein